MPKYSVARLCSLDWAEQCMLEKTIQPQTKYVTFSKCVLFITFAHFHMGVLSNKTSTYCLVWWVVFTNSFCLGKKISLISLIFLLPWKILSVPENQQEESALTHFSQNWNSFCQLLLRPHTLLPSSSKKLAAQVENPSRIVQGLFNLKPKKGPNKQVLVEKKIHLWRKIYPSTKKILP